jgi:hypothetical protein
MSLAPELTCRINFSELKGRATPERVSGEGL